MSISIPGDAQNAYNTVVKGDPKVEWAIFSLASAGSELKLQSTGSGLDDLQEEFMDGRIQYAFARVEDPNTSLERFIQINWCGDGVAAFQKGLFNTYSPQISGFLKATHIVLQARNEDDVTPDHIYKRMRESSGSKYGAGNAAASTPAASSFKAPPPTSAPKPYVPTSSSTSGFNKPTPGPSYNRPTGSFNKPTPSFTRPTASFNKPTPAPAAEETLAPPPREPTPPPAPVAAAPSPPAAAASKPAEDDRIAPVGTAYEPVKLAAPKKLTSRWGQGGFNNNADDEDKADEKPKVGGFNAARSAFTGGAAAAASSTPSFGGASGASSGKKLTWSERQAETKRQREAEEKAATDAMSKVSISANDTGSKGFGYGGASSTPSAPPPAPPAADEEEDEDVPPPPPPPPAPLPPRVPEPEESKAEADEEWDDAPPAPPPPPMASRPVVPAPAAVEEDEEDDAPPPPPPPPPMPMPMPEEESAPAPVAAAPPMPSRAQAQPQKAASSGPKAKALYDYEATEDNEISFNEEDVIEGIEQTDPDWWTGIDPKTGSKGLFPSNYVELMQGGDAEEDDVPPPPPAPPAAAAPSGKGKTAIAQYDYEATEDNEVSFAEGDEIVEIEETDPDWWTGTHAKSGQKGLFPANYVEVA